MRTAGTAPATDYYGASAADWLAYVGLTAPVPEPCAACGVPLEPAEPGPDCDYCAWRLANGHAAGEWDLPF